MNRIALTLALTLLAATSASAQQVETGLKMPEPTGKEFRGYYYASLGANLVSRSTINGALSTGGFPTLPRDNWGYGGGAQVEWGRWVLVGDFEWVNGGTVSKELPPAPGASTPEEIFARRTRTVSLNAFKVQSQIGYSLLRTERISITPLLGLATVYNTMQVHEADHVASTSFDSVLGNPGRGTVLTNAAFAGIVALGIDYRHPYSSSGSITDQNELLFGLRVGYAFSPDGLAEDLQAAPTNQSTGQNLGFDGPFVRLVVGFGLTQNR